MIFIFTALKPEAQAFVDKYRLEKSKLDNFTIYLDTKMVVIITGVGVDSIQLSCECIENHYKILESDTFINIGICASDKEHNIGELLEISSIKYRDSLFNLNKSSSNTITCLDYEAEERSYKLVDMESFGFYKALHKRKNIYMCKEVSDHFEPRTVTKEKTKMLVFSVIDKIFKEVGV